MKHSGAPVLLAALLLAGCETFYGFASGATLTAPPDMDCIASALDSVEGVEILEHRHTSEKFRELSPDPGTVHMVADIWLYRFDTDRQAGLVIRQDNRDGPRYTNGFITTNSPVEEDYLQALEMIVTRVDAVIARDCGIDLSGLEISRR